MVASVAVRQVKRKSKTPKPKINKEFAKKKPLPGTTAEETIKQYHNFAVKTARGYIAKHPGTKLEYEDAYAIVCMALFKAHQDYNPEKGANFITYASRWARAYLFQKGDLPYRLIHIPLRDLKEYIKEKFALAAYEKEVSPLYLTHASRKIYNEIRKDRKKLSELRGRVKTFDNLIYLSHLETPVGPGDKNFTMADMLTDEEQTTSLEAAQGQQIRDRLKLCIEKLDERETYVVHNRIMSDEPESLVVIGKKFNLSRERIRQIEVKALNKLRLHILNDSVLSSYKIEELCNTRIPTEETFTQAPADYGEKRRDDAA